MDFSTALKGMAGDIYSDRPHYEVVLNLLKIAKSENSRAGSLWSAFNRGLSAIFTPQSTLDWAKFLTFVAKARQCGAINPKLIGKPFEHYAVEGLNTEERLRLLTGNYFSSLRLLTPQIFRDLWQEKETEVVTIFGKAGRSYLLSLGPAGGCSREGEYAFKLVDPVDGVVLAQITFLFVPGDQPFTTGLLIGGLQGPSPKHCADAQPRISAATRHLSGLKPKMAVYLALAALAAHCKASIYAVSNDTHVINADAYYQRKKLKADYDAFWTELGGDAHAYGFQLPVLPLQDYRFKFSALIFDSVDAVVLNRREETHGGFAERRKHTSEPARCDRSLSNRGFSPLISLCDGARLAQNEPSRRGAHAG